MFLVSIALYIIGIFIIIFQVVLKAGVGQKRSLNWRQYGLLFANFTAYISFIHFGASGQELLLVITPQIVGFNSLFAIAMLKLRESSIRQEGSEKAVRISGQEKLV